MLRQGRETQASDHEASNVETRKKRRASNDEESNVEAIARVDRRTSTPIEGTTVLPNVSFPQSLTVETQNVEDAICNENVSVSNNSETTRVLPRRTKRNKTTRLPEKR